MSPVQTLLVQSVAALQALPSAHFGASAPPQSTSVSSRFFFPSVWVSAGGFVPLLDPFPELELAPPLDEEDDDVDPPSSVAASSPPQAINARAATSATDRWCARILEE